MHPAHPRIRRLAGGAAVAVAALVVMARFSPFPRFQGQLAGMTPGYCCAVTGSACLQTTQGQCPGGAVFVNGTSAANRSTCDGLCGVPGYCCTAGAGAGPGTCQQMTQAQCAPGATAVWHGSNQAQCTTNAAGNCASGLGAAAPAAGASQCTDGADNDADGLIDSSDSGCYFNGSYNTNDDDETDPVCPDQYTTTVSANMMLDEWYDDDDYKLGYVARGNASCGAPGGGWTLVNRVCLSGGCSAEVCLWKAPSQVNSTYSFRVADPRGAPFRGVSGYGVKATGCLARYDPDTKWGEYHPASDNLCQLEYFFLEKAGLPTALDIQMNNCGGPPGPNYGSLGQLCPYQKFGGCVCLWGMTVKRELCLPPIMCGNSFINTNETCDDSNIVGGDGCSAGCEIESGFLCTGIPSICTSSCTPGQTCPNGAVCPQNGQCPSLCGNGVVDPSEQCDDRNTAAGDGCSAACQNENTASSASSGGSSSSGLSAGSSSSGAASSGGGSSASGSSSSQSFRSSSTSSLAACGNGLAQASEQCDDANARNGDGCSPICVIEDGWECIPPAVCVTVCGDAVRAGAEQCDDGNRQSGDGCSQACAVESGWMCMRPAGSGSSSSR